MNQELWNKVKNADLLKQVSEGKEVIWQILMTRKQGLPVLHRLLKKYFPKQSQQTA